MSFDPQPSFTDWFSMHQLRASLAAGIDRAKLGGWATDFATTAAAASLNAPVVAGSGAANALATLGGRYQLTTGATGSSSVRVFSNALTVQPNTDKIYMAVRLRVVTVSDANSDNRLVMVVQSLANDWMGLQLKNGVLNLILIKGGVPTTVPTSWTPETTNYHDFAVSLDKVTARAFVDAVEVGNTAVLTNATNTPCNFETNTQNGASTADQQTIIDKAAVYTEGP